MLPLTPDSKYPLAQRHFDDAASDNSIYGDVPHIPEDFQSEAPAPASAVSTDPIKPADFRKCGLM